MKEFIEKNLKNLNIETGPFIPDGVLEESKIYFGYTVQEDFSSRDQDYNDITRISIIGFLMLRNDPEENSLKIIDDKSNEIRTTLSNLNFKVSIKDVTQSNEILKKEITANAYCDEKNKKIIY